MERLFLCDQFLFVPEWSVLFVAAFTVQFSFHVSSTGLRHCIARWYVEIVHPYQFQIRLSVFYPDVSHAVRRISCIAFSCTRFSVETKPGETNHRDFTHCRPFRSFSFKSLFMKTLFPTKRSVLLQTDRFFMFFLREKVYAVILFPASVLH